MKILKKLKPFFSGLFWVGVILLMLISALLITAWQPFQDLSYVIRFGGQVWTIKEACIVHAVTLMALVIALWRIIATYRQIKLFTETEELRNLPSIIEKINEVLPSAKKEVYFMANVLAIGATGAPEDHDDFRQKLTETSTKLGGNFHSIYVDPEKNRDDTGLTTFYRQRKVPDNRIDKIVQKSKYLHKVLHNSSASYYLKDRIDKIKLPHFILIDPLSNNGKAIIWNLDKSYRVESLGKISGVGFYTRNTSIINTHEHIFEDTKAD